jgi:hypothetical protein
MRGYNAIIMFSVMCGWWDIETLVIIIQNTMTSWHVCISVQRLGQHTYIRNQLLTIITQIYVILDYKL